jgi:hypothetical protein
MTRSIRSRQNRYFMKQKIQGTTVYFEVHGEPIVLPDPEDVHPLVNAFGATS